MKLAGKMKQALTYVSLASILILNACAASRAPIPRGTVPLPKAPTQAEEQHGHKVLAELTNKYKLDYNHPRYQEMQNVMKALTEAAGAAAHPWHIYLLQDANFKNAGATKGNHIFLWTAMLDYTRNKEELAGVLAHEVAHVLARHTDEDQSEKMRNVLVTVGAAVAGIAASQALGSAQAAQLAQQLAGKVGQGLFVNPYSQVKELEADQVGIFLMAKAKFNPEAAVSFWQRASNDRSFGSGPSFFSTHPSSSKRLSSLKELLPDAMLYYRNGTTRSRAPVGGSPIDVSNQGSYPAPLKPSPSRQIQSPVGTSTNTSIENTNDSWDIRN